jgi:hypothetical protein
MPVRVSITSLHRESQKTFEYAIDHDPVEAVAKEHLEIVDRQNPYCWQLTAIEL